MPERVVITGSRHWDREDIIRAVLDKLPRTAFIAHGYAKGADRMVDIIARELGFRVRRYPVDASLDGPWPGRGPVRNRRMVDDFKPTAGIAFRAPGKSNGTDGCVAYMRSKGVPVHVVVPEHPGPSPHQPADARANPKDHHVRDRREV